MVLADLHVQNKMRPITINSLDSLGLVFFIKKILTKIEKNQQLHYFTINFSH